MFYRGQDPSSRQLAQVINGFRDTYGLSIYSVSVDGVLLIADCRIPRTDRGAGAAPRREIFPAAVLVDPKQGVRRYRELYFAGRHGKTIPERF
ncbi:conjugal transfer protein TraF [Escherichia coli]|uniref:conjugal transfer protein TraF n=1 Tax=Escherichia coli TaxID=562 RepID=UPI003DA4DBDC